MFDKVFESKIVFISFFIILLNQAFNILSYIIFNLGINIPFELFWIIFPYILGLITIVIVLGSIVFIIKGNEKGAVVFGIFIVLSFVFGIFDTIVSFYFNDIDYIHILLLLGVGIFLFFMYKNSFYRGMFDRDFRKAMKLDKKGEKDKALNIYQDLSRKNKEYPKLYYKISKNLSNREKYEEALLNIDKALKLKPKYSYALHQKGFILIELERYDEALKYTDLALKYTKEILDSDDKITLIKNKIYIFDRLKMYDLALKCCDELITIDSDNKDNFLLKLDVLISFNCQKEALILINRMLEDDENNLKLLNSKSLIFYSQGNYLKSLKYFDKILSIDRFNSTALYFKTAILIFLSEYEKASKYLEEYYSSIDQNDEQKKVLYWILNQVLYSSLNDYEKALEFCNKCLKVNNKEINYYLTKIGFLKKLEHEKEAEKCCKHILKIIDEKLGRNPNDVDLLLYKVDTYIHLKKCDKADELLKSIKIDSRDKDSFDYKGVLLDKMKIFDEALENFNKALKIDPENPLILNNKGHALIKLNKFDEALNTLNKALKIIPNYLPFLHNKGYAFEEMGNYDEALKYYDKGIKIDPYNKDLQEDRKELLEKIKKQE